MPAGYLCDVFVFAPGRAEDFHHALRQEGEQDERVMELELVEGSVATAAAAALASAATKAKVQTDRPVHSRGKML